MSDEQVSLQVSVANTGSQYSGRAMVQLYVSAPQGRLDHPFQELKAFTKSGTLAPGEKETLTLTFAVSDLTSWDEAIGAWMMEPGDYLLRVGQDAAHTEIVAALRLAEEIRGSTAVARLLPDTKMDMLRPISGDEETMLPPGTEVVLLKEVHLTESARQVARKPVRPFRSKRRVS